MCSWYTLDAYCCSRSSSLFPSSAAALATVVMSIICRILFTLKQFYIEHCLSSPIQNQEVKANLYCSYQRLAINCVLKMCWYNTLKHRGNDDPSDPFTASKILSEFFLGLNALKKFCTSTPLILLLLLFPYNF